MAYAPNGQPERLVEKLGERYEIAETDIKKWTVGSPIRRRSTRSRRCADSIRSRPIVKRVTVRLAPSVAAVVDNRDP